MVDNTTDGSGDNRRQISRRELLIATGVAGLSAGCASGGGDGSDGGGDATTTTADSDGGNGDGGSDGDSDGADGKPVDPTWTWYTQTKPDRTQFNPYNPKNSSGDPYDRLAYFNANESKWVPNIVTDWTKDGDTVTLKLDDRFKWHNGEPVVAEDLEIWFGLEKFFGNTVHDFVEDWTAVDDQTVELTLNDSNINEGVFYNTLLGEELTTYREKFRDYLKQLEEAEGDESAVEEAQSELMDLPIEDPVGNSPYKLQDVRSDRLKFSIFEDYPFSDKINYPTKEVMFAQSDQQRWLELTEGELDGHGGFGVQEKQVKNRPERVDVFNPQENATVGHFFNHNDEWFGKREVRLAIAHAVDLEAMSKNSNSGVLSQYTGMPIRGAAETWLGDLLEDFTYYGKPNKKRAEELLGEAGLSMENGQWVKPDGNPLTVPIKVISGWNVAVLMGQTMVSTLQDIGIKAELVTQEGTGLFGESWAPGNFKVIHIHSGFGGFHPYFYYKKPFTSDSEWSQWSPPEEVEIPMPIGDPDGSLETMQVGDKVRELRATTDENQEEELVKQLAWAFNQSLPYLISAPYEYPQFLTNDDWDYPAAGSHPKHLQEVDQMYRRAGIHEFIQKRGIVQAKTE